MISHLLLVLGLFIAGVELENVASGPSADVSVRGLLGLEQGELRRYHNSKLNVKHCNECLKVVFNILKKAADEKEEGGDFFDHPDPCIDFPNKEYDICNNVIDFIEIDETLNIMKTRKFCAKANYCPSKRPRPVKPRPVLCSDGTEWGEGSARCNMAKSEYMEDDYGTQLQTHSQNGNCTDCEKIIATFAQFYQSSDFNPAILPFICWALPGQMKKYCLELISQYEPKILEGLKKNQKPHAICETIKQCDSNKYLYCKGCKTYTEGLLNDEIVPEIVACSYLPWKEKQKCARMLREKSPIIERLLDYEEESDKICRQVHMCPRVPHRLLIPKSALYTSEGSETYDN